MELLAGQQLVLIQHDPHHQRELHGWHGRNNRHGRPRPKAAALDPRGRRLRRPLFPVGHDHASTTSIYTCVSSDFRTRTPASRSGRHGRGRAQAREEGLTKRQVSYQWRLREKMAAAWMFTTSELAPPLA
ncbi:hypothetical protein [Streptomyces europaeiscabiei]|uniref:hypothetical protein n=1 Tax=Streptomyces europaeiscabiei TaxID=146819 RepID=UPI002E10E725|nr:hypothetical protein OHB30_34740 [Streptomyces europaeiscabiei]